MNLHDEVSFLPEDYRGRKVRRRTMWIGTAVSVGVITTMGLLTLRAQGALRAAAQTHAEIERNYDDATGRFNRCCQQRDVQRKIIQHAALARTLVEKVPFRSNIIPGRVDQLPAGRCVHLVELTLESHARPGTDAGR